MVNRYNIPPGSKVTIRTLMDGIVSSEHAFDGTIYPLSRDQVPPPHQGDGQVFIKDINGDRWYASLTRENGHDNQDHNHGREIYYFYITRAGTTRLEAWLEPYNRLYHMDRDAFVHFISFKYSINVAGDLQYMSVI